MFRNILIPKGIARKPIPEKVTYLQFGFVIMERERYSCPRCKKPLDAGPNYQPRYCDQCGQKLTFAGIEWKEERELGFARRAAYESIQN